MKLPPALPGLIGVEVPTICVDFDGTLVRWNDLMGPPVFELGAVEAVRALSQAGFRIVVLTSRLSREWLRAAGYSHLRQYMYINAALIAAGVPVDLITAEKVPAVYYIDDRAIQFAGNWGRIAAAILKEPA